MMHEEEHDFSQCGPKMRALSLRRRLFVAHYCRDGGANPSQSAREAGYEVESSGRKITWTLMHDPIIAAAIKEESLRLLATETLTAGRLALHELIHNPQHRDHMAAIKLLAKVTGFGEVNKTEQLVTHELGDRAAMIAELRATETALGLRPGTLAGHGPMIDVEPLAIENHSQADATESHSQEVFNPDGF